MVSIRVIGAREMQLLPESFQASGLTSNFEDPVPILLPKLPRLSIDVHVILKIPFRMNFYSPGY